VTAEGTVQYEIEGPVGVVTLAAGPHNVLGPDLFDALFDALDKAEADGCRAVVLRSGLPHFSAGDDVGLLRPGTERPDPVDRLDVLRRFETLPVPVVASVHGVCVGGGFDLVLLADYVIAARSALLGSAETTVGLTSLLGAVQRLTQRVGPHRAKEIVMLGRRYEAETLERWGVINLVVNDDLLEEATRAIALELANGPTVAHAATKQLALVAAAEGVAAADARMVHLLEPVWQSGDVREGLRSFREQGPGLARFEGR
jgi:enoyl-CoA hydratase/carnithine racemase